MRSFVKKIENNVDVNELKINIKILIFKIIKSLNNMLKKIRRNHKSKKQHVKINTLIINVKFLVKKF